MNNKIMALFLFTLSFKIGAQNEGTYVCYNAEEALSVVIDFTKYGTKFSINSPEANFKTSNVKSLDLIKRLFIHAVAPLDLTSCGFAEMTFAKLSAGESEDAVLKIGQGKKLIPYAVHCDFLPARLQPLGP